MRSGLWSQWSDLTLPDSLAPMNGPISNADKEKVTFYCASYTGGALDLAIVPELPNLRVLQLPNAGYEDALAFARDGLTICNARGVHDASTAELAISLTLASLRGLPDFFTAQQSGRWQHQHRHALADRSVAIIGYGSIGQRIARILEMFEARVFPYSRSGSNGARPITQLDEHLPSYDVVILIAPATAETRHLFNAERIARMKNGSLLVNVARGTLVDTDALVTALNEQRLFAAVDVTDPEPLPLGHPLWSAPNLIISPHVGGDTSAFEPRMRQLLEEQARRFAENEPLLNVVWPEGSPSTD